MQVDDEEPVKLLSTLEDDEGPAKDGTLLAQLLPLSRLRCD